MTSPTESPEINVLLLGDSQVGKSAFIARLTCGTSPAGRAAPLPVLRDENQPFAFDIQTRRYGHHRILLSDTSSPTNFTLLRPDMLVLCFSVSDRASLTSLTTNWKPLVESHFNYDERMPILVLGLKRDTRVAASTCTPSSSASTSSISASASASAASRNDASASASGTAQSENAHLLYNAASPADQESISGSIATSPQTTLNSAEQTSNAASLPLVSSASSSTLYPSSTRQNHDHDQEQEEQQQKQEQQQEQQQEQITEEKETWASYLGLTPYTTLSQTSPSSLPNTTSSTTPPQHPLPNQQKQQKQQNQTKFPPLAHHCIHPNEALQLAQAMRCDRYAECSAITGELVKEAWEDLVGMAMGTRTASGGKTEGASCAVM